VVEINTLSDKCTSKHRVYLVRHGEVNIEPNICYGQLDCPVADSFSDELAHLVTYFLTQCPFLLAPKNNASLPLIISSPLQRCHLLAQGLQKQLQQACDIPFQLQINEAFKEINFGQWEGQTWENIGQPALQCWSENLLSYLFPDGESAQQFHDRVIHAWNALIRKINMQSTSQTIIIVCHAGVIRSILSHFLNMPLQHSLSLNIDKGSVSCLSLIPNMNNASRCLYINRIV